MNELFTPEEARILKSFAAAMLRTMARNGAAGDTSGRTIAEDSDLDSRFGDPKVRRDPKHWAGASYVGAHYSQCPTDYLIVLAESLEYFADKDQKKPKDQVRTHTNGTPYWAYNLKDAARARGWAARNRGKAMPPPAGNDAPSDDGFDQGQGPESYGEAGEDWTPT